MSHLIRLSASTRAKAIQGVQRAPEGWYVELREAKRSDDQNAALWSLLQQVQKQRPIHNGVKMTRELWKATFMDALGAETTYLPKLEGGGLFPLGQRTSTLSKPQFSELIELILEWCARTGVEIKHFDGVAA